MALNVTNTFVAGNLIKSSEVNTNFNDVGDYFDGNNLNWDTAWNDAVHDHSSDAEGGELDINNASSENSLLIGQAQNAYQILKQSGSFDNEDFLIADIFTDIDGVKNTINTGASSAVYSALLEKYICTISGGVSTSDTTHDPDSFTDPNNFFDFNATTKATKSSDGYADFYLGKTFSEKHVGVVRIYATTYRQNKSGVVSEYTHSIILQTYDGTTWNTEATLASKTTEGGQSYGGTSYNSYYALNKLCQGVRIWFDLENSSGYTVSASGFIFDYNNGQNSNVKTETLLTLDGTEKSIYVYGKADLPTNTSITYDAISSGGGSATGNINEGVDVSGLSAGNLSIDFDLSTTDGTATPTLSGYGVYVVK